jgi:hypothetical protein
MNYDNQEKINASACFQNTANIGMGLRDVSDFRYNLQRRIDEAVGAAHTADKLIELRDLLSRNPEVARILELRQELGV